MSSRSSAAVALASVARARCRCGHLPTHHMVIEPIAEAASFRLDPVGPCAICGEAACRRFQPGPA